MITEFVRVVFEPYLLLGWCVTGTILAFLTIGIGGYLTRMARTEQINPRHFSQDEQASASVEYMFALVVLIMTLLVTIQTTFLINAQFVMDYAAYRAARTAALTEDREQIRTSAAIASVPIAPALDQYQDLSPVDFTSASQEIDRLSNERARSFSRRLAYANEQTSVADIQRTEHGTATFSETGFPKVETVKVRVEHEFYLVFPVVRTFFKLPGEGDNPNQITITETESIVSRTFQNKQ